MQVAVLWKIGIAEEIETRVWIEGMILGEVENFQGFFHPKNDPIREKMKKKSHRSSVDIDLIFVQLLIATATIEFCSICYDLVLNRGRNGSQPEVPFKEEIFN